MKSTLERYECMNSWDQIKQSLAEKLGPDVYHSWFAKTAFRASDGDALIVTVPNEATRDWMAGEYADSVLVAIRELKLPFRSIRYEITAAEPAAPNGDGGAGDAGLNYSPIQLNSKFRFDTFVVGSCNQFAHAAARAVATSPSKSYNP